MSTIKVSNLQHASAANPAIVLAADGSATAQLSSLNGGPLAGARNRIINGDMRIDQRNAGAAVTVTDAYVIDRWKFFEATDGAASCQRVADVPAGFTNSAKITITTADSSLAASQRALFFQQIEGLNTDDLAFGTASAKTIALSFWVKSSVTGAFGGCLMNGSGTRSYPFSYAISSANTWEQKSLIVPGETTGTWATDNTSGLQIMFCLGTGTDFTGTANTWSAGLFNAPTGSTNLFATLSATWQVTGVQLEPGTVATPFERRSYGQELALCQRYYEEVDGQFKFDGNLGGATISVGHTWFCQVSKRSTPTVSVAAEFGSNANNIGSVSPKSSNAAFCVWEYTNGTAIVARAKAAVIRFVVEL